MKESEYSFCWIPSKPVLELIVILGILVAIVIPKFPKRPMQKQSYNESNTVSEITKH